ncbi:MAG: S-layer homology domain-containing protein [Clostridia bacterium]|nr:S-layer homology domain-containing protein [Clostridia bacterium]
MFKKQIGCFILTLCMMTSMVGALPAQAEELELLPPVEGQTNVIVNGDFETLDEAGNPTVWLPHGKAWEGNSRVSLDTSKAHSGKNSLKITETNGDTSPWIRQVIPLTGGAVYQLSGYVFIEKGSPLLKFEGYNAPIISAENATRDEAVFFHRQPDALKFSTGTLKTGEWVHFTYLHTPHPNTQYAAMYFRLDGDHPGTIWYDDLSIQMVEGPSKYLADINSYNYYLSETEGTIILEPNAEIYPNFSDWTVNCRLLDGEEELWSKEVSFAKGKTEVHFSLAPCTDPNKEYIIETTLYDGEETEIKRASFIRRYPKPTRVADDKLWRDENGEIFHPVISYHLYKLEDIDKYAKDMGINVIQMVYDYIADPEAALEYLDELHKRDLKALVTLYYQNIIASDERTRDMVTEYIKAIKGHPAIWAYGTQDEPIGKNTEERMVTDAYRLVREIDPDVPVYTIDQREWMYPQLVRNLDIMGMDNYPYGSLDAMTYIYNSTSYAVDLAGISNKPVYPILQFFARGNGKYNNNPNKLYCPTGDALRNMIYQSLMAGAKGFGFYAFDDYDADGVPSPKSKMADSLRSFNKLEKDLMFEYFVEGKYPTFASNYNDNENARWASFVKDGEIYMVVLNKKEYTETEITIPLVSDNGLVKISSFSAEPYAGGGEATRGIRELNVVLGPAAATVYKIKPSVGINLKKLIEKVEETPLFTDLTDYDWAKKQIEELHKKEIVNVPEEGKFLPGEKITRGEFAYFLVRTLGLETEDTELFADVPADSFYAKEIAAGKTAGILKGIGENRYAPKAEISRQDMMTLIARGLELKGKTDLTAFADADEIADYAKEGVEAMIAEGLIEGNADGTLNPLGNTTRAEAAVIMHRILERRK